MLPLRKLQITRNVVHHWIEHQVFGVISQVPDMGELELILPP
jgi:hypothetical protein